MISRSLEDRLTRLEDADTIRTLVVQYGKAADRNNDPDMMRALFEKDCVWESPQFGRYEGIEALVEAASRSSREAIVWTLHYNVSVVVHIDDAGTGARCHWHLWEPMKLRQPGGSDAETWFGATYDTLWRKNAPGLWKMSYLYLETRLLAKVGESWPGQADPAREQG